MTPARHHFDLDRIGAGLPAAALLPKLRTALDAAASNLVIQAPPGTGKTTVVPPAVAEALPGPGRVLVTAPRRVAVRAAARRLAELDGSALGGPVGFSVRGEHHRGSRVQFLTPGVLMRQLLADPELPGVSAVILDEVHERQLDTDLLLGMLAELSQLRDDLSVIAMSATLDAAHFAGLLDAPVLELEAPIHPLAMSYAPAPGPRLGTRGVEPAFLGHLARQTLDAVHREQQSALVFLPGVREIDEVDRTLRSLTGGGTHAPEILPLHGRLSPRDQDRALRRGDRPRIVLATPVAESSLTVPGVRIVIDSGLSRSPRRDATRGMTGLITTSCAQAAAEQRAGRAGREGPGTVIRCYSAEEFAHFAPFTTPEIRSADLTQAALWLAAWCTPPSELPLLSQPPEAAWSAAVDRLRDIGALSGTTITELGRRLSTLPLPPHFGAALLRHGAGAAPVLAVVADDPRGDVEAQVRQGGHARESARLRRLTPRDAGPVSAGVVVGTALPMLLARREEGGEYLLAGGTRAQLSDPQLGGAPWLAVADISRSGSRALIRAAARISEAEALKILGVTEETRARVVAGKVRARRVRAAGAIELSATPTRATPEVAAIAVATAIAEEGLSLFHFSAAATALAERLRFLQTRLGEPWPDIDAADPALWLAPELEAIAAGTELSRVDMHAALQRLLPWPEATRLAELAPTELDVPSGRSHRLDYATGRPVLRVKLQECFGLAQSPLISGVAVQFHLLSPAGRPLAITDDLASFWSGPYAGVRADMRGRYPRHPWPEDPWSAPATARTRNRT